MQFYSRRKRAGDFIDDVGVGGAERSGLGRERCDRRVDDMDRRFRSEWWVTGRIAARVMPPVNMSEAEWRRVS